VSVEDDSMGARREVSLRAPYRTRVPRGATSSVTGDAALGLEPGMETPERNGHVHPGKHRLDTRLHFRSSASFSDELEGRVAIAQRAIRPDSQIWILPKVARAQR
jgi:hypothetical protein